MHSAPAVSYPVGRSRLQAWLVGLVGSIGVLVVALGGIAGWHQWLFVIALLGTFSLACDAWRRAPRGSLRWDGQAWGWQTATTSISGVLVVHLDFQSFLLLSLTTGPGVRLWLWPEQRSEPTRWHALRRAVFFRTNAVPAQDAHASEDRAQVML